MRKRYNYMLNFKAKALKSWKKKGNMGIWESDLVDWTDLTDLTDLTNLHGSTDSLLVSFEFGSFGYFGIVSYIVSDIPK